MLFGIIIVVVAVFVAYTINKSKVSEVKIEAPEKIEPTVVEEVKKTTKAKATTKAAKTTKTKK
jgi:hypothetical protein